MKFSAAALATAALIGASAASAVTIDVEADGVFDTRGGTFTLETFESQTPGEVGAVLMTGIGQIFSLGGTGGGSTVVDTGTELAIKDEADGNLGGRFNVTPGGSQFLDSNDTTGMGLIIDIGEAFSTIAFSLTDAADVGATMTITGANNAVLATASLSDLANSNLQLVTITFDMPTTFAAISLSNDRLNDGFGIDDVYVGTVPLPASALLMLAGLGAISVLRTKRRNG